MDNYRRPMYTRNRMGSYQGQQQCGCGYTPIMDAVKEDRCDKRDISDMRDGCGCVKRDISDMRDGCVKHGYSDKHDCGVKHDYNEKHDCCDKRDYNDAQDHCNKAAYCDQHEDTCIDKLPLAMAYVPFQRWENVYDACAGIKAGTIFQDLNLPFYGYKNMCGMRGDRYDK